MVRDESSVNQLMSLDRPGVTVIRCDLTRPITSLVPALQGIDAVVHLAAAKRGGVRQQVHATVGSTQNLLNAIKSTSIPRIIAASSFAVYDYANIASASVVTEESPLVDESAIRDAYSHAKLLQEKLVLEHAATSGLDAAILRLGAVFGPGHTWTARLGRQVSARLWLRIGSGARVPVSYVEHSAESLLLAAEKPGQLGVILNVLDDDPPTQAELARELARRAPSSPLCVTMPWLLVNGAAKAAATASGVIPFIRERLPSLVDPAIVAARFKPLSYTNHRLHEVLGWRPRFTLSEALDRCFTPCHINPHAAAPAT